MKKLLITILLFHLFVIPTLGQAESLTISDTKISPSTINVGGKVLISCQVTHPDGPTSIERVAATLSIGNLNSSYPMLYDDGTNGDEAAEDGIYSLQITVGNSRGEAKIVFIAVDTDQNEIESAPVTLTVQ